MKEKENYIHSSLEKFDAFAKEKWGKEDHAPSESLKAEMKANIMWRISSIEDSERRSSKRLKKRLAASLITAAAFASLFVASLLIPRPAEETRTFSVTSGKGQKSRVELPDGSKVWLNSESRIAYNSDFNKTNRRIDMKGEAYFEVSPNKNLPFIVKAEEISVEALGTTFNIMAYGEKNEIITTLVEGKILTSANGQEVILSAGERCGFNKNDGRLTQQKVNDMEHIVPWKNNELLFENESLSNVAVTLERLYDVKVVFSEQSIKQYTYTGLIRNNSLNNILELISNTSPVDYAIKENIIEFSKR